MREGGERKYETNTYDFCSSFGAGGDDGGHGCSSVRPGFSFGGGTLQRRIPAGAACEVCGVVPVNSINS